MKRLGLTLALATISWAACMALVVAGERPDPTRWEKKIVEIEKKYQTSQPDAAKVDVVFIGSSSIRMWDLASSFPGLAAVNCGFGGSHIADSTHYVDRLVKPFSPRQIVIYAGDNDIKKGLTVEQVVSDYQAFVAAARQAVPDVQIHFVAIKPCPSRWVLYSQVATANRKIQELTESDEHATFIDIATAMLAGTDGPPSNDLFVKDRLHLSKKGYAMWNAQLKPALTK